MVCSNIINISIIPSSYNYHIPIFISFSYNYSCLLCRRHNDEKILNESLELLTSGNKIKSYKLIEKKL